MSRKERRVNARLDFSGAVTFESTVPMAGQIGGRPLSSSGTAADISDDGLCLTTQFALQKDDIIKIKLPLPGVPVQMPTLAMVRWVSPVNGGCRAGMMFIV